MLTMSILIPAYIKDAKSLVSILTCLNSLQATASRQVNMNFFVQDDCSPFVFLPNLLSPCAVSAMRNEQNLGFSGNVNTLAARTDGDIIVLVNQDIEAFVPASVNWDIAIASAFEDEKVGIVGAKLLFPPNPDGAMGIQSAGGLLDAKCQPFHRWLGYTNHLLPEYSTPEEVTWVTGAAFAIRRSLFEQLGGFDPIYAPSYFEDVDTCLRARELGYKVWYEPRATFIHSVGSTGGSQLFGRSATAFRERWADTKRVKPDTEMVKERFW